MSDKDSAPEWRYFCSLPTLSSGLRDPFEAQEIAIVPPSDPRVKAILADPNAKGTAAIHGSFETHYGKNFEPCALIFNPTWPKKERSAESIRAFRNAAAISTLVRSRSRAIAEDGQWEPLYSDFFDFFPLTPSDDEQYIVSLDMPVRNLDEPKKLHLQPAPWIGDPSSFSVRYDRQLWRSLSSAWERHYRLKKASPALRQIFRSLDVAYHAGRFGTDGLRGTSESGIRIGLWVSAIEVLVHPGTSVSFEEVHQALGKLAWQDRMLERRPYSISRKGSKIKATFIQRFYKRLYDVRNAFFHGNKVTDRTLYFNKPCTAGSLEMNAVLIYVALLNAALERALPKLRVPRTQAETESFGARFDKWDSKALIERGLLAVAKNRKRGAK